MLLGLDLEQARRKARLRDGTLEAVPEGVVPRTRATDLHGLARFLLGLGCSLTVRRPDDLKEALQREAQEIVQRADQA